MKPFKHDTRNEIKSGNYHNIFSRFILIITIMICIPFFTFADINQTTALTQLSITANTGEKPQSKVWTYDGDWWAVLPSSTPSSGTHLWKLVNTTWTWVMALSSDTDTHADVKVDGDLVHILLYRGASSELISL